MILDAAALELSQRGYAGTAVAQVAKRAEISEPLVHASFDSEEGLCCACVRRAGEEIAGRFANALAAPPASVVDQAVDVLHAIFVALEPRPHNWKVLHDPSLPEGSLAAETARRHRRLLVEQGAAGVSGRSPRAARHEGLVRPGTCADQYGDRHGALVAAQPRPSAQRREEVERRRRIFELLSPQA